jgi:hypothetical protein
MLACEVWPRRASSSVAAAMGAAWGKSRLAACRGISRAMEQEVVSGIVGLSVG